MSRLKPQIFLFSFFSIFLVSNHSFANPETQALLKVETYDQLVHAIRETRAASHERAEQAVEQEKVREAWETGRLIHEHVLHHKKRADYGKQVLLRLAQDLKSSERELQYMLEFFRAYPIPPQGAKLSWSHYRALLHVKDTKEREELAEEAVRQRWGRGQVRAEVRRRNARNQQQEKPEQLEFTKPGKFHTYRVVKAAVGPLTGQLVADLGFSNYFQPEKIGKFKERDIVTFEKGKLKKIEAGNAALFTYNAYVTQVIDGDTIRAVVDLGFKIATVQTLRLRGIDAPEIQTSDGKEAKEFLEKTIKKGGVIIRTEKSDKYDRYLADVWVEGHYVNQELLDEDLAIAVHD